MGTPSLISLGPGILKTALLATSEPTDLATGWPVGWVDLGYTFEGSAWRYELRVDPVEVAEELEPIRYAPTGRTIMVQFTLAEITATNIQRALNGGTISTGSGFVTFEPPDIVGITRRMYGWQSDDLEERWIFRQCLSSGTVETTRRKGADKAGLPFELNCEKPAAGGAPFKAILATARA